MKKQLLSVLLVALLICIAVCGCTENGKDGNRTSISDNSNQSISSQLKDETNTLSDIDDSEIDIYLTYNYSEDLAWVIFNKGAEKQECCGCIDKSGNLVFYTDKDSLGISPKLAKLTSYSNGYAYIETKDSLYLLDKTGNILKTYNCSTKKNDNKVVAYADGYVWYQECVAEFDEAYYTYTLYDFQENSVTNFKYNGNDPIESMNYYGKKVWGFYNRNKDKPINSYYFTDSNKWVDSAQEFYFLDDISLISTTYDEEDTDIGYLAFIDTEGELTYTQLPDYVGRWSDIKCYAISEDCCVLYNHSYPECIFSYNISSGEFIKMDNEYTDKINYDSLPDNSIELYFENGKIALRLTGTDKESYVGLFDTSWNIIDKPLQTSSFDFSDGKLITNETSVYDDAFNLQFSAEDFGYKSISPYHNGIAHAKKDGIQIASGGEQYGYEDCWFYIDSDGNRLFDTINTKSATKIQLQ